MWVHNAHILYEVLIYNLFLRMYFSSLSSPLRFPPPLPPSNARYQRPDWNSSDTATFAPLICISQPQPNQPLASQPTDPPLPWTVTTVMVMQPSSHFPSTKTLELLHTNGHSLGDEDNQVLTAPRPGSFPFRHIHPTNFLFSAFIR